MALLDLLELGDLLLSWRLSVGIAATGALCWLIFHFAPNPTLAAVIGVPLAIAGVILSFRWQLRVDMKS
jgi:hypothetical protein